MAREKRTVEGRRVTAGPGVSEVVRVRVNGEVVVTWVYKGPGSPNTSTLKFLGNPATDPSKREQDALCRLANAEAELIRSKARIDKDRAAAVKARRTLPLTTTVKELCELYLASDPCSGKAEATQRNILANINSLIEIMGDRAIGDLTGEEIWRILRACGRKPGTQEAYYIRLRGVFVWAKHAKLITEEPMDKKLRARFAAARLGASDGWYRVALKHEEVTVILKNLAPKYRDLVRFALATALRARTLRLLRKEWVSYLPDGAIDVSIPATAMKDKRPFRLDVTALRSVVDRAMATPGPRLFPSMPNGAGVAHAIRKAARAGGLPVEGRKLRGKELDLHAIRHSAASFAGNLPHARHCDVKELLRHKTDHMVNLYMQPVAERQKEVQRRLASLTLPEAEGKPGESR